MLIHLDLIIIYRGLFLSKSKKLSILILQIENEGKTHFEILANDFKMNQHLSIITNRTQSIPIEIHWINSSIVFFLYYNLKRDALIFFFIMTVQTSFAMKKWTGKTCRLKWYMLINAVNCFFFSNRIDILHSF